MNCYACLVVALEMSSDQYVERPLFGGAIFCIFPLRFEDVSNIREVPDQQEVFVDPARDESLIFELLEYKHEVADNGSANWFLQDLASEQDADGGTVIEQSCVVDAPGLSYKNIPSVMTNAVGQMVCKFYRSYVVHNFCISYNTFLIYYMDDKEKKLKTLSECI